MSDPVGTMVSSKQVGANKHNAKKSTGPRTFRGKSHARWNALQHGAFAKGRLIQGEDKKAYQRLSARVFAETTPDTAVECMLVDQIVGDLWRLRRVEQAERAYFEHVRAAALARAMRTLSLEELSTVASLSEKENIGSMIRSARILNEQQFAKRTESDSLRQVHDSESKEHSAKLGDEMTLHSPRPKLEISGDLNGLMLDGMVSPQGPFPYDTLERIRRSLVRDVLRKCIDLAEL